MSLEERNMKYKQGVFDGKNHIRSKKNIYSATYFEKKGTKYQQG